MEKQQLAREFNQLTTALVAAATSREIGNARVNLEVFTVCNMRPIAAALTKWAQQDDVRRRALEEAEQACRARAQSIHTRVDYHASPTLVARASEADDCADAMERLAEEA